MPNEPCNVLIDRGGWSEDWFRGSCTPPIGPRNTWSNLAYAAVGIALAWRYQDAASAWMAMALCVLAVGSGAYHAFKTVATNRMDWVGMYATFGALVGHGWAPNVMPLMVLLGAGLVLRFMTRWRRADWHMIAAGGLAALPVGLRGDGWSLLPAVGLYAAAQICFWCDKQRVLRYWGHALWHVFAALAIGALFISQRGVN